MRVCSSHVVVATRVMRVTKLAAAGLFQNFTHASNVRLARKAGTPVHTGRHRWIRQQAIGSAVSTKQTNTQEERPPDSPIRNCLKEDCQSSSHRVSQKSRNTCVGVMVDPVGCEQSCLRMMTRMSVQLSIAMSIKPICQQNIASSQVITTPSFHIGVWVFSTRTTQAALRPNSATSTCGTSSDIWASTNTTIEKPAIKAARCEMAFSCADFLSTCCCQEVK